MEDRSPYSAVVDILEEVSLILRTTSTDLSWSSCETSDAILLDLMDHIERLTQHDPSRTKELAVLFAPTGPLQEVSISSGWGERFVRLAARLDQVVHGLR